MIPSSPWFAVTSSGSSVHFATSERRRAGSGSISADVLSEIGMPGQMARTARIASAHGWASRVCRPSPS